LIEELSGGRGAAIYRKEDKVLRPAGPWSPAVHTLLNHLERVGFSAAPKSFGFDDNDNEILSFVPGETTNFPLDGAIVGSHALISAAELLRAYHDASSSLIEAADVTTMRWMLPTIEPIEVICHGDFAPYNVALNGPSVVGVFDFDTAHPGSRIWDIAYAVYTWAPFKTHSDDAFGDLQIQMQRAKLFCDAYSLGVELRLCLVEVMVNRIQALVDFMHTQANQGNQAFLENINDGHHLAYLSDIAYLKENENIIAKTLVADV
jgi:hypothetical protein